MAIQLKTVLYMYVTANRGAPLSYEWSRCFKAIYDWCQPVAVPAMPDTELFPFLNTNEIQTLSRIVGCRAAVIQQLLIEIESELRAKKK